MNDLGCGRKAIGCDFQCPFGFPCTADDDCLSGSCTASYCDVGRPTGFGKPMAPAPKSPSPPPTASSGKNWNTKDIKSLSVFGTIIKEISGSEANREFVPDPAGGPQNVIKVRYPAGSYKPAAKPLGGITFYANPIDMTKANIVTLEYKVFFPSGFNFVKGGKLPGLMGGSLSCSGGNSATDCFSTRFMVIIQRFKKKI